MAALIRRGGHASSVAEEAPAAVPQRKITIFFVNIRGLVKNQAELMGHLRLLEEMPEVLCFNETWLDKSVGSVPLEGYACVARRDRRGGRGGGIATYVHGSIAQQITHLGDSERAERHWLLLHAEHGPLLLGNWYRLPGEDLETIRSLESEWHTYSGEALGHVFVGDMNVHLRSWLRFSQRDTVEGKLLREVTENLGLKQLVRDPTREGNLLDLAFTNMEDVSADVGFKIADHQGVTVNIAASIPKTRVRKRTVWDFRKADWDRLKEQLATTDWSSLSRESPEEGAKFLLSEVLDQARACIPQRDITEKSRSHGWLTAAILRAIQVKRAAEGSDSERTAAVACSQAIMEEYRRHIDREKRFLEDIPRGSKRWWKMHGGLRSRRQRAASFRR